MLRYLFALMVLISSANARGSGGVWVVFKNATGENLEAVSLAGYEFGNLRSGEYSHFEKVERMPKNVEVKAKGRGDGLPGQVAVDGGSLSPGYHLLEVRLVHGRLEVVVTRFDSYFGISDLAGVIERRELRANEISIEGAVRRAGIYSIDELKERTLAKALELAGGMWLGDYTTTPAADTCGIEVHREVDGKRQTFTLNMRQMWDEKAKDGDFVVRSGDVIVVPICF